MSDTESVVEQEPPPNTDKFKEYVREWIKIYDRLSEIRKDTAVLNKRKKEIISITRGILFPEKRVPNITIVDRNINKKNFSIISS